MRLVIIASVTRRVADEYCEIEAAGQKSCHERVDVTAAGTARRQRLVVAAQSAVRGRREEDRVQPLAEFQRRQAQ